MSFPCASPSALNSFPQYKNDNVCQVLVVNDQWSTGGVFGTVFDRCRRVALYSRFPTRTTFAKVLLIC